MAISLLFVRRITNIGSDHFSEEVNLKTKEMNPTVKDYKALKYNTINKLKG